MSEVKQKYLRDENGNVFSPITSENSIYREDGSVLSASIPLIYKYDQPNYVTSMTIFSGNISSFDLLKIYGYMACSSITTGKAVYLKINNTTCSQELVVDVRFRDAAVSHYNRIQTSAAELYFGDVAYSSNTSYFEVIIPNRPGAEWNCIKSVIGNATSTSNQFSWSSMSGQFQQTLTPLTKIELVAPQGVQSKGIVQIYR